MERSDRHCTGRMRCRMMGSDLLSERSDLQQTLSFCIATMQIQLLVENEERSAGARRPAGELSNGNISNQQEATAQTSSWYWKLAMAKRCRLNKSIRQRFASALKIQQMAPTKPAATIQQQRNQQQRFSSDTNSAATQLQQLAFSDADLIFSTKILDAKQDSLYRKLHHGNSKIFLTHTKQISRSNRRIERSNGQLKLVNHARVTVDVMLGN
ncbi:hypothetical protein F511_34465 [Dorcoceras hygrometricum]|uniref:Uncharacterized protein n=1 Tax=Dorcoceras hygrometricum TaxID=472368 RepID=A0A2Z7CVM3_9LAMI|nr:hypothetical protein F511_34465 [Dorcoceras hygrometricum]